jgi:putative ABC transport system permease protein
MTLPLPTLWQIARRDLNARIRGLRLLAICLFLGVATLAAIGSLTSGIAAELSNRGQTILGGDIQVEIAQRSATAAEIKAFQSAGVLSQTIRMRAMAIGGKDDDSLLAELKAVDAVYPLYGALTLADGSRAKAPPRGQILIAPTLANRLSIGIGDTVRFGEGRFKVAGILGEEPDRLGEGFTLGPVAIIGMDAIADTGLIQPGSLYNAKYCARSGLRKTGKGVPVRRAGNHRPQQRRTGYAALYRTHGAISDIGWTGCTRDCWHRSGQWRRQLSGQQTF